MKGTATELTICGHDLRIGDYVEVQYTTGTKFIGAVIKGKIVELWSPKLDGHLQARVDSGWCFHDHDRILTFIPGEPQP